VNGTFPAGISTQRMTVVGRLLTDWPLLLVLTQAVR